MCGIAGAFALDPGGVVDRERVGRMTERVRHRGPDGEGTWTDERGRVCLGHRRLSIIDLANGQQPMRDPHSGAVITFNGEIYNYVELRDELVANGESFRTASDTEVLLRLYLREGEACLDRLHGMFAFAIYDPRRDCLILARDRIGKKPLYYSVEDRCFYFGSTFAALRAESRSPDDTDIEQIETFLALGYIPAPRTAHPDIAKLPAGTVAIVDARGIHTRTFWDVGRTEGAFDGTWEQAVDQLDELINTAVAIRLRSDVPLGVFLSGGIDSSLVAAVARRQERAEVLTFSIGFDAQGFDERPYARAVADHIGSEHREFVTRFDALGTLPDLVRHFGEPFGDQSAVPLWLLARETRKCVTVAVGGDGGDEGFGGYDWYGTAARINRIRRFVPGSIASAGAAGLAALPESRPAALGRARRAAALLREDEPTRYVLLRSLIDTRLARNLYNGDLLAAHESGAADRIEHLARMYRDTPGSSLRRMRTVDIKTYLAECLMPKVDVATMAHGLEARAPLLDHAILEFALSLPDHWIREHHAGKRLLRAVLERYLPAHLFHRPKQGFDMPLTRWFNEQLQPRLMQLADSPVLLQTNWFRQNGLQQLVSEQSGGQRDHSLRLYNLLILEEWLGQCI